MAIRDRLITRLTELGTTYDARVIGYEDAVDVRSTRTIQVKQRTIAWLAGAPRAAYRVDYIITLTTQMTDAGQGEADLDEWVPALLADLTDPWLAWTSAQKVLDRENMAYDVDLYLIATLTDEVEGNTS